MAARSSGCGAEAAAAPRSPAYDSATRLRLDRPAPAPHPNPKIGKEVHEVAPSVSVLSASISARRASGSLRVTPCMLCIVIRSASGVTSQAG